MRKRICVCLLVAVMCLATGCGKQADVSDTAVSIDNAIHLYQMEGSRIVAADADVQLKTPDVLSSCVEDAMTAFVDSETGMVDSYSYMIGEDNSLQLELTLKDGDYEKEKHLLLMAAATKTLFQIDDIEMINLTVKDSSGEVQEQQQCMPDTFYFYDASLPGLTEKNVSMYQPNSSKTALTLVIVKENESPQISDQELIVRELVNLGVLPKNTKVNQVSVYDNICYLDLSGEFLYDIGNSTPELVIYSLVNSVVKQTGVSAVQILVDGKIETTYRNAVDISQPVSFNTELVEAQ